LSEFLKPVFDCEMSMHASPLMDARRVLLWHEPDVPACAT